MADDKSLKKDLNYIATLKKLENKKAFGYIVSIKKFRIRFSLKFFTNMSFSFSHKNFIKISD